MLGWNRRGFGKDGQACHDKGKEGLMKDLDMRTLKLMNALMNSSLNTILYARSYEHGESSLGPFSFDTNSRDK